MALTVTLELPDDAFSILRSQPDDFVRELRLAAAVKWYELGRISQSKAAELAGVSRHEFLMSLAKYEVSPFQDAPSDLALE